MGISFCAGSDPAAVMAADEAMPVVMEPEAPVVSAPAPAPAAVEKPKTRAEIKAKG